MRSKVIAAALILCLVLGGCSQSDQETANDIDSVELKSNQEIVIAKITQINGNEMTYTVAEEADTSTQSDKSSGSGGQMQGPPEQPGGDQSSADTSKQSGSDSQSSADTSKQSGSDQQSSSDHADSQSGMQRPDGAPSGGDMQAPPDGNMPSENGQDRADTSNSQTQSNSDTSNSRKQRGTNASSDQTSEQSGSDQTSSDKSSKKNKVMYTLTDETGTMMIPVGTKVITSLGKQTTFSRLSNGDVIKMIVEKDSDGNKVIVGIWIV